MPQALYSQGSGVPRQMSYQGVLREGDKVVADGKHTLQFKLYTTESGGQPIWQETQLITMTGGLFNVTLGVFVDLPAIIPKDAWIGISIDNSAELIPRTKLMSAPYSFNAGTAQSLSPTATGAVLSLNGQQGAIELRAADGFEVRSEKGILTIGKSSQTKEDEVLNQGTEWVLAGNGNATANSWLGTNNNIPLIIRTNNAERMRILSSNGNVGIGETAPNSRLSVARTLHITNTGGTPELKLSAPSGANSTTFKTTGQSSNITYTLPADDGDAGDILSTDGTGVLTWSAGGWGMSGNAGTATHFLGTTNAQPLIVRTNNTERYRVTSSGAMGINEDNPTQKLEVAGNVVIKTDGSGTGELRLQEPSGNMGNNYTGFKAGNLPSNIIYTLPTSQPLDGQVLSSNNQGILTWATPGGASGAAGGDLAGTYPNPTIAQKGANTGEVLKWNGTSWQPAAVALQYFTEARNVTAANATVPVHQFAASGTEANIDIALTPKGAGALTAQVADGTATGGDKRGTNAVDWQMLRVNATEVASGLFSTISGGTENAATGWYSTIGGGWKNSANGSRSTVAGGRQNSASGINSTVGGGALNITNHDFSTVAGGYSHTASGIASTVSGGYENTAAGDNSSIIGGSRLTLDANADRSFGFNGNTSAGDRAMTISAANTAVFGNVDLWLASNDNAPRSLRFYEQYNTAGDFPNGSNYVGFRAPNSIAADVTWTLPDADGTSGQVLTTNGSGALTWANDGVINFTSNRNATAPNDTRPVHQFAASGTETNIDIALTPKGTGALTAQIANNAVSGGNKRGENAVDWQSYRDDSTQVASGTFSVIGGGQNNTASNDASTVSGGQNNTASAMWSTIGGGLSNVASTMASTVGGGARNTASGQNSVIDGGTDNIASGQNGVIGGGTDNIASGQNGVIGGGTNNTVQGLASTISGGNNNQILTGPNSSFTTIGGGNSNVIGNGTDAVDNSIIAGGDANLITSFRSVISGGTLNKITTPYSVIGGGYNNNVAALASFIGGGTDNTISGGFAVIGGGNLDTASGNHSTIGGGYNNNASGHGSFVGGGGTDGTTNIGNVASGNASTIGGGIANTASGNDATIGGGQSNYATNFATTISGGQNNTASGSAATISGGQNNIANNTGAVVSGGQNNTASNFTATVAGGFQNTASGQMAAVAGGQQNSVNGDNSVIGGGSQNTLSGNNAAIVGGRGLTISGDGSVGFLGNNSGGTRNMTISEANTAVLGNVDLWLASNDNTPRSLRFYEQYNTAGNFPNGSNYVGFRAPNSIAADVTWTLPAADGTSGQVLSTNGSGTLTWTTAGGTVNRNSTLSGDGSSGNPLGINLSNSNTWTANQTFASSFLIASQARIALTNADNNARDIRWQEPSGTGSQYIGWRAPNVSNNGNYVFPATVGSVGQVLSISTSNGIDSARTQWTTVLASGSAAGGDLSGTYPNPEIAAGTIVNADINASAAIAYSKLALTNSIQNSDITANAITTSKVANGTVTTSKLADSAVSGLKLLTKAVQTGHLNDNAVTSIKISDGTITNSDINASAAIAYSKLNLSSSIATADIANGAVTTAKISSSGANSGDVLTYNGTNVVWAAPSGGGGAGIEIYNITSGTSNTITITNTSARFHRLDFGATMGSGTTITINLASPSSYDSGTQLNFFATCTNSGGSSPSITVSSPSGQIYLIVGGAGNPILVGTLTLFSLMTDGTNWYRVP